MKPTLRRQTIYLFLTLLLLLHGGPTLHAGRLFTADKLTGSSINCITQDRKGYLWVGTDYGLNRFDGYSFRNYLLKRNADGGIIDNIITTFLVDREGRLWIGTSKGVMRYDSSHDRFIAIPYPDRRHPRVYSLAESHDGDILVGSAGYGLYYIPRGEDRMVHDPLFINTTRNDFFAHIFEDSRHQLWQSSHLSTFSVYRLGQRRLGHRRDFRSPCGAPVKFIETGKGNLLIVCLSGLLRYDARTQRVTPADYDLGAYGRNITINNAFVDRRGTLYLGTSEYGILCVPRGKRQVTPLKDANREKFDLTAAYVKDLYEDKDGNLWAGCYRRGLYLISRERSAFHSYTFASQDFSTGTSVTSLAADGRGGTWCTVQNNGVYHFSPTGQIDAHPTSPAGTSIIYRDREGHYWVGTGTALYSYDPATGHAVQRASFQSDGVWCMHDDAQGHLYFSVYSKGLYCLDTKTGRITVYSMTQQQRPGGTLCNDWVRALCLDRKGRLWIGTSNGVSCLDTRTGRFDAVFKGILLKNVMVNSIAEDPKGGMVFGTDEGLSYYKGLRLESRRTVERTGKSGTAGTAGQGKARTGKSGTAGTAGQGEARTGKSGTAGTAGQGEARTGKSGTAGTAGQGEARTGKNGEAGTLEAGRYPGSGSLDGQQVNGLTFDQSGELWVTTSMGLYRYDRQAGTFTAYVRGSGLDTHEYVLGAILHNSDDRIVVGHANGITAFDPSAVRQLRLRMGQVYLTGFDVDGQEQDCTQQRFTLSYQQNSFVLQFSLLTYQHTSDISYSYRINDGKWTQLPEGTNAVPFTRLAPGTYHISVRAMANGQVSAKTCDLTIRISPPWYASWPAIVVYVILAAALVLLILNTRERRRRTELEDAKMKFLIDATHDIRSPLTLIMAPLKKLRKRITDQESVAELDIIHQNAERLMLLVNQILDERKIDKGQLQLHPEPTDVGPFVQGILNLYHYSAEEHHITLRLLNGEGEAWDTARDQVTAGLDQVNIDKVVSNLLSNAMKYTPDGGRIDVVIGREGQQLLLTVRDTGPGFGREKTEKLFERFYQGARQTSTVAGTGIGLNLCRSIVQLHGGKIKARNRKDGEGGAEVIVSLPLGLAGSGEQTTVMASATKRDERNSRRDAEKERQTQDKERQTQDKERQTQDKERQTQDKERQTQDKERQTQDKERQTKDKERQTKDKERQTKDKERQTKDKEAIEESSTLRLLVVDDDASIASYIKKELGHWYRIDSAANGKEALEQLFQRRYALVISDVKMPVMDGIDLVRHIKGNVNLSDTPVILLSSKSEIETRMEGLRKGADAYMAKPFDIEELHVQVDNLVRKMRRLRGKYSGAQTQEGNLEQITLTGNNDDLMKRIMKSVNAHLSDPDFNVERLTEEVGISRSQLHRKMKEMTGISTNEFIRNLRMEEASRLLKKGDINVTQVAYAVGFNSQTHFSTVFKRQFGVSPTQYAQGEG